MILSLDLSAFLYGLDTTIAADIQAAVVTTFGNVEQLSWIGTGFALGSVATVLPIGAMYGRFNQKWLYLLTFTIFEIGSALCGAAPNMNALIVGRVIAGVGGSGIYLGVLNYVSAMTTDSERGLYVSAIGLVWGLGCVIGPIIGGSFSVSSATWRWAFYINLVLFAVSAPISIFLPPIRPQPNVTFIQKMLHFDWIGSALSATFWVLFTVVVVSVTRP